MVRYLPPLALLLVAMASAPTARAGDAVTAEALYRQGRALMDAGDFAGAEPKLAESYAQDPGTGAQLALALCEEQTGKLASAWENFAEVVSKSKRDGRADRETLAQTHQSAIEPKLSHLTVTLDGSAAAIVGLVVTRDGVPTGSGAWGTPVSVDPGEHAVVATAPGKREFKVVVKVGPNADAQTVTIPALADEVAPANTANPATPADVSPHNGPPFRTIGIVVGGAGIVGLGLSGFFALRAKSLDNESKQDNHCNAANECDATGGAKRDDAKSAAGVATGALIAGSVLTAAGVTLFVVGASRHERPPTARIEGTAVLTASAGALIVRGSF